MPEVEYENMALARQRESSKNIREHIKLSHQIHEERFQNSSTRNNSGMIRKDLEKHVELSDASIKILE